MEPTKEQQQTFLDDLVQIQADAAKAMMLVQMQLIDQAQMQALANGKSPEEAVAAARGAQEWAVKEAPRINQLAEKRVNKLRPELWAEVAEDRDRYWHSRGLKREDEMENEKENNHD